MPVFNNNGGAYWDAPAATQTFSHTVSTEDYRLLTVAISVEDSAVADYVNSVTWNSDPMTLACRHRQGTGYSTTSELYYILAPDTGTHDVEITFGTNRGWAAATSADFYNVEQTAPNDVVSGNSGGNVLYLGATVTPTESDNIVIAAGGYGGTGTFEASGSATSFGTKQQSTQNAAQGLYQVNCSTGGEIVGFLAGASQRIAIAAATWDNEGQICNKDLKIFYGSMGTDDYICCNCSRWDVQSYSIVIETWLTKTQLQILRNNIVPQAVGELYTILGKPLYYDQTWEGNNTIQLTPNTAMGSNLKSMRDSKLIYVKNITDSPLEGPKGYLHVKIEGMISGSQNL